MTAVGPVAIDLVTGVAAILLHQMPALHEFGRRRLRKPLTGFQFGDFVVASKTRALGKSLRIHRVNPVRILEPAVLPRPFLRLLQRIRGMGREFEIGGRPLPFVTRRAGEDRDSGAD